MSNRGYSSNRRICSCALLPQTRGEPRVDFTPRRPGGTRTTNGPYARQQRGQRGKIRYHVPSLAGREGSAPGAGVLGGGPVLNHLVNQPEVPALLRRHIGIAFEFTFDCLKRLARVADVDLIQPFAQGKDFARLDLYVGRLTLGAT